MRSATLAAWGPAVDGAVVLLVVLYGFGVMDGVLALLLAEPGFVLGGVALAFAGLARNAHAQTAPAEETYANEVHGYGPLIRDPNRLLDLPEGFTYQVVSQSGDTMDDGLFVPGQPDGMACFPMGGSLVALVRNHELKGVFGANLFSAIGAANGVQQAGQTGTVKVVAFDAPTSIIDNINTGLVDVAIAQHPAEIGYYGVMTAYAVTHGQSAPVHIGTGSTIMTKDNIDDPNVKKFVYSD